MLGPRIAQVINNRKINTKKRDRASVFSLEFAFIARREKTLFASFPLFFSALQNCPGIYERVEKGLSSPFRTFLCLRRPESCLSPMLFTDHFMAAKMAKSSGQFQSCFPCEKKSQRDNFFPSFWTLYRGRKNAAGTNTDFHKENKGRMRGELFADMIDDLT